MGFGRCHGWRLWLAIIFCVLTLAGCASPKLPTAQANEPEWQGRFSLRIKSEPEQSMSASFRLRGEAAEGSLDLYSPLGTTLAVLRWSPKDAQLLQSGQVQRFDSMNELTEQATGAALPLSSLFDWLNGLPSVAPGWHADLSQLPHGLLIAQRLTPTPAVHLRIKLD